MHRIICRISGDHVTKSFIITKMLDGCDRLYKTQDVMQPITFEILQKLHNALHHVCTSRYEMVLFQTAFCISFAVFLRVGEMSLTSNSSIDRIIQKMIQILCIELSVEYLETM
jgi:hypothetical protein